MSRLRPRVVPGAALRIAERQEQLTAGLGGRGAVRAKRLERHPVQADGFLVGELGSRAVAAAPSAVDRLPAVSPRRGLEEVVRELREVGVQVRRVENLEGLADLTMELYSATSRNAVVGAVPDQGVGEAHAADPAGNLGDHARLDPLVEQLEDRVTLESADARQRIEIELAAEDRGQG